MKVNKIKINAYGKLKDVDIDLENGVNIIYGKNEAGKSTLINFIINSFYGISKNKNGREISDYDKYKPWDGEEFSGKVEYELDSGKKYEIYRDFNKKNPKIFNENMEDISKEFNIDRNLGNQFFYEQTKIDEDLFLSTLAINQNEIKLDDKQQNFLVQKIANLAQTGDDSTSFKRVIDRINRRQLDEIGTERSREKPINVIQKNLQKLQEKKEKLEKYKDFKYEVEEKENNFNDEINMLEIKKNYLAELKLLFENEKIESEKIKIKENLFDENSEKINLLNKKIDEIRTKNSDILGSCSDEFKPENKVDSYNKSSSPNVNNVDFLDDKLNNNLKKGQKNELKRSKATESEKRLKRKIRNLNIALILLVLINIFQFIFVKNKIFKFSFLLTIPVFLVFYVFYLINGKKEIKEKEEIEKDNFAKVNSEIVNLKNEKKMLEENQKKLQIEIDSLKNELSKKLTFEVEKIKNKYEIYEKNKKAKKENIEDDIKSGIYKTKYFEKNISENLSFLDNLGNNLSAVDMFGIDENFKSGEYIKNINYQIQEIQNKINNKKIELHTLEIDKKNIESELDDLAEIDEQIQNNNEKFENFKNMYLSMNLAKDVLFECFDEMKNQVTPRFTENLSRNISKITDGKYNKVMFNEEEGLIVELENGNYLPVNRFSIGTIDQLYLSLRLSMIDELSNEKVPILLDEAFAFYDDDRLKNILMYLYNEFKDRQVIIFSCTDREQKILKNGNAKFNCVEL